MFVSVRSRGIVEAIKLYHGGFSAYMNTQYNNFIEISGLQLKIMEYVQLWVQDKKTPVPLTEIIKGMVVQKFKTFTTVKAISVLLKKGYIRRAISMGKKSYFVQLKRI